MFKSLFVVFPPVRQPGSGPEHCYVCFVTVTLPSTVTTTIYRELSTVRLQTSVSEWQTGPSDTHATVEKNLPFRKTNP